MLLIVSQSGPNEYNLLAERLRQHGLEVVVRGTNRLFSSLAELQVYDTVVLANVPRATSDEVSFSDEQIDMLVRNTQQMVRGAGHAGRWSPLGAGGWTGTELEKAMPVDFQIRNAEGHPPGRPGPADARQRNPRRQRHQKRSPRRPSRPSAPRIIAA